jgi:hypothetical protein
VQCKYAGAQNWLVGTTSGDDWWWSEVDKPTNAVYHQDTKTWTWDVDIRCVDEAGNTSNTVTRELTWGTTTVTTCGSLLLQKGDSLLILGPDGQFSPQGLAWAWIKVNNTKVAEQEYDPEHYERFFTLYTFGATGVYHIESGYSYYNECILTDSSAESVNMGVVERLSVAHVGSWYWPSAPTETDWDWLADGGWCLEADGATEALLLVQPSATAAATYAISEAFAAEPPEDWVWLQVIDPAALKWLGVEGAHTKVELTATGAISGSGSITRKWDITAFRPRIFIDVNSNDDPMDKVDMDVKMQGSAVEESFGSYACLRGGPQPMQAVVIGKRVVPVGSRFDFKLAERNGAVISKITGIRSEVVAVNWYPAKDAAWWDFLSTNEAKEALNEGYEVWAEPESYGNGKLTTTPVKGAEDVVEFTAFEARYLNITGSPPNAVISASTSWPSWRSERLRSFDGWGYDEQEIDVGIVPSSVQTKVLCGEFRLRIVRVVNGGNDSGRLSKVSRAVWRYSAFEEPKTNHHPPPCVGIHIIPEYNGTQCGQELIIRVQPVYDELHRRGLLATAMYYVFWKYQLESMRTDFHMLILDPSVKWKDAAKTNGYYTTTLGPNALVNENKLASTLVHEDVHQLQPVYVVSGPEAEKELLAYTTELLWAPWTGIDAYSAEIAFIKAMINWCIHGGVHPQ